MLTANVATAKNNLSHYLRRVKAGERVIITERDRPIAQLQAFTAEPGSESQGPLHVLLEIGVLAAPGGPAIDVDAFLGALALPPRPGPSLSAALLAEREEGR